MTLSLGYNALKDTFLSTVLIGAKLGVRWREALDADLEPCLRLQPHSWGHEIVGKALALAIWKELLRRRSLIAGVVEKAGQETGRPVLGFGSSVFVTPEFIEAETRNPSPGINSRIIASVSAGQSVILDRQRVARGNGEAGLDVVFLSSPWWTTSNAVEFSEMMMASVCSCIEAHAGYRLRSAMVELSGQQVRALGSGLAGFVLVKEFCEVDRALLTMRKESAAGMATDAANLLFHYLEPRLDFHDPEQMLLIAALQGATDQELSNELGVNVSTVKKRWRSIFIKVDDLMPELFTQVTALDGTRGPQRRHLVLSYVREHPEELRPFARA